MDRLPICLLTPLLLITLWNTVIFKSNLTSSHGLQDHYTATSSVKMSSESQKILNQCFQQEESNQSFQAVVGSEISTFIHPRQQPHGSPGHHNTQHLSGVTSPPIHRVRKNQKTTIRICFSSLNSIFACRFGVLTTELWIQGQSTPVCNSNVGKFSMMLPYSTQERQKMSLTHFSSRALPLLL